MRFSSVSLDDLTIDDERSFRHVGLYGDLKQVLAKSGYRFRVPEGGAAPSWDRVVFLNLTFWTPDDQGDVLAGPNIEADVVAHVAWHHLCRKALPGSPASADSMFLGESIASAFDLFLVGRLLGHAPEATFLETQVPAMADAAENAGLDEAGFESLLESIAADPDRAFEDLRALLFDAGTALLGCAGPTEAARALEAFEAHRFAPLLHHYELSNWILYARAHAARPHAPDPAARAIDEALRSAKVSLDWLDERWVQPALRG
ncbi:MAG: hypothetical protein U0359_29370 [Byssovorax sp.]